MGRSPFISSTGAVTGDGGGGGGFTGDFVEATMTGVVGGVAEENVFVCITARALAA